jgi:hypothetical protein
VNLKHICASIVLALAILIAPGLRADVTIRYQSEFKPPAVAGSNAPETEAIRKGMQGSLSGQSIRMKGNKAYTTTGNWVKIFDFVKQDVTLIDPAHKTFATFPISQFADKMAGAMPQSTTAQMQAVQQAFASIKTHIDSKITGKTAEIMGVQAEEREVTVTIDIPMPAEMNQTGPGVRLVMHIWTAKKEEALRVPAIRELTGYQAWQKYVLNPMGMSEKVAGNLPGMADTITPMLEEIYKNPSVILRTRTEVYTPFLAAMAKRTTGQGQAVPAADPNAPLVEINEEVAELSSDPVDASLFEIPADYAAVDAGDIIRDMVKAQTAAATAPASPK